MQNPDIEMLVVLRHCIEKYIQLSDSEYLYASKFVKHLSLKKNDVFVAEGSYANYLAFTYTGYLRVFYNHDGNERTRDITPLHSFATALPSFVHQQPSYEIIAAATDCDLLVIHRDSLYHLYDTNPKWERLGRRIIEDMFILLQYRLFLFIRETAEQRYKRLLAETPDILMNVPLQYIASYLGVTLPSLSRLRRNL